MTQIPNTPLWIEVVPIYAHQFEIYTDNQTKGRINVLLYYYGVDGKLEDKSIWLPEGKFEIVGTVTETKIDSYVLNTSQDSFRSLLEANGFYWVNPLGKKPSKAQSLVGAWELLVADSIASTISKLRLEQWRDAESKKLKPTDKLIILKQII
jgi:hypothetical protein